MALSSIPVGLHSHPDGLFTLKLNTIEWSQSMLLCCRIVLRAVMCPMIHIEARVPVMGKGRQRYTTVLDLGQRRPITSPTCSLRTDISVCYDTRSSHLQFPVLGYKSFKHSLAESYLATLV